MSSSLSFYLVLLLLVGSAKASGRGNKCQITQQTIAGIGVVVDYSSRVGKEQKIAMKMAIQDLFHSTCARLDLHLKDSQGNSAGAIAGGKVIYLMSQTDINVSRLMLLNLHANIIKIWLVGSKYGHVCLFCSNQSAK